MTLTILARGFLALALFAGGVAHAQLFRAYLASNGLDSNPCTLPAPCRLLPAALAAIADGGEIWMLDSANFNGSTVNITKSVSILAVPGAVGSVIATAGPALSINTAGVKVALRNLVVGPFSSGGTWGVLMLNGAELTIDGCVFANLPSGGVNVNTIANVRVVNTLVRNSPYGLFFGSGANASVASVKVLESSIAGILGASGNGVVGLLTTVDVSDSIVAQGTGHGIWGDAPTQSRVDLTVTRSTISQMLSGVRSTATNGISNVVVASSTIVSNGFVGLVQSGVSATLTSFGNNVLRLNGSGNTSGTITTVSTQ